MPVLYIVAVKPNGNIVPIKEVETLSGGPSGNPNQTYNINETYNLLAEDYFFTEGDKLGLALNYNDGGNANIKVNNISLELTSNAINLLNSSNDLVVIEPNYTTDFTNNDWNALFGNAFTPRKSQYYMDVDYSTSPIVGSSLTPINFIQLIQGIATKASVQDYYYNLQRHTIPRYEGSRTTAAKFNEYTNGDTGYGKEIVAGNLKPFVGYYTSKGGSTPEVLKKTIINLDYIIDEDINTQVPALSDFTYDNQIQLFERGTYLYLDPDKNATNNQFAGNNKYKIYRSGEYATPILYSQIGNSTGYIPSMSFYSLDENGESPVVINNDLNTSILAIQSSNNLSGTMYKIASSSAAVVLPSPSFGYLCKIPWTPLNWNQSSFLSPLPSSPNFSSLSADNVNLGSSTISSISADYDYYTILVSSNYQFKAKIKLKVKTNPNIPQNINGLLEIAFWKGAPSPNLSNFNYDFSPQNGIEYTSIPNISLSPGTENFYDIEFETDYLTAYTPPSGIQNISVIMQFRFNTDNNIIESFNAPYFLVEEGSFSLIQDPLPNQQDVIYSNSSPYITDIQDYPTYSEITFNRSFTFTYGYIYPQVSGSGYDSTIYPFEITPESPNTTTSPNFEIRFDANEIFTFPILQSKFNSNNQLVLKVYRKGLALEGITGDARQSFLIRRWVPRAGYIYLDIDAPLGKGIIKPEFITKGIQDKLPQITKELTDKGLI